ncbi:hypothetical protein [Pelagibacterium limicola]|uniref:hypothetical protein n=1 Tax=Pelagibacterium limicola TaxID=2791022 RepID=UPI0018AF745B|nr:hypothetical protein [Pelagibacterium limicola]
MLKPLLASLTMAAALLAAPVFAQDLTPNGTWVDQWGTTFTFELCGDGTQLCGVLNDIQGESRTEENLAFVDEQVVAADQVAPNQWEGQIALNGGTATAKVEMIDENTLTITGCQFIICNSIEYVRA